MAREGGEKRKKQWMGGRDGNSKRHKGALGAAANGKGHGGVLVTCDKTKERQSVADALNILNEAADRYFPVSKEGEGDVSKFKDDKVSPTELLDKIFEQVEKTKEFASRFIMRMIPLEKVGYSSVEAIKDIATPMIKSHLEEYKQEQKTADTKNPLEFAVEFKRRNCTNLNSMDVINALVDIVGPEDSKVNLTTPRSVLLIEVFRGTCGFSIVKNFHRYKKYNVRSTIDPPVPGQQTQKRNDKKENKTEKSEEKDDKTEEKEKKEDVKDEAEKESTEDKE
ncbi:hypothetical protein BBO99_00009349 [Phytophthora kernoviae]|uniref:THUMP domain-containing protein n=2 Tax=Phytophthora kernoviae TaxID=325452 RepID=A0A421GCY5_9STRA|nr:hypothetical protein G195_010883 [Phytophthora kernoviae 00238/432]KAG2505757.1 hypothetical protein JM16_008838 [Phytophthora kernoviae]KAG2508029.1 hypothetical protein JM18_009253 [Phytophthora kernoviae]RLN43700.1 hypothetical protein BBI17_009369 [Phytophthora kernoviae]RLN73603.1 hypothetical protein BBO99_00009349 [Phytophthora kernoviae]